MFITTIRLPTHLRTRWMDVAHSITESNREQLFSDLTKFVDKRTIIASFMFGLDLVRENNPRSHTKNRMRITISYESDWNAKGRVTTLVTQRKADKSSRERLCRCCSGICVTVDPREIRVDGLWRYSSKPCAHTY